MQDHTWRSWPCTVLSSTAVRERMQHIAYAERELKRGRGGIARGTHLLLAIQCLAEPKLCSSAERVDRRHGGACPLLVLVLGLGNSPLESTPIKVLAVGLHIARRFGLLACHGPSRRAGLQNTCAHRRVRNTCANLLCTLRCCLRANSSAARAAEGRHPCAHVPGRCSAVDQNQASVTQLITGGQPYNCKTQIPSQHLPARRSGTLWQEPAT